MTPLAPSVIEGAAFGVMFALLFLLCLYCVFCIRQRNASAGVRPHMGLRWFAGLVLLSGSAFVLLDLVDVLAMRVGTVLFLREAVMTLFGLSVCITLLVAKSIRDHRRPEP